MIIASLIIDPYMLPGKNIEYNLAPGLNILNLASLCNPPQCQLRVSIVPGMFKPKVHAPYFIIKKTFPRKPRPGPFLRGLSVHFHDRRLRIQD